MSDLSVSIVLPCYNEAHRLEPGASEALERIAELLTEPFELVWVNDGSTDGTHDLLEEVRMRFPRIPMQIVGYPRNRGKGHAVQRGVLVARGDTILVMDADFSIDLHEMAGFLEDLNTYDVVIGSKKHAQTETVQHQSPVRRFLGKSFTVFSCIILQIRCTDITCGLKGFTRKAGQDIFSRQRIERWAYDAESLFLAARLGYRLHERPVKWFHVEGSKVSPLGDTIRSAWDVVQIVGRYVCGGYRGKTVVPREMAGISQ
jgi:glycosyltransferase involved in cell wall biosynthesis